MDKLLLDDNILFFQPSLADVIGLEESILLQKLYELIKKDITESSQVDIKDVWVRVSYKQWLKTFPFWTENKVFKILKSLEEYGIVKSKIEAKGPYKHKAYNLVYGKLTSHLSDIKDYRQKIKDLSSAASRHQKGLTSESDIDQGVVQLCVDSQVEQESVVQLCVSDENLLQDLISAWNNTVQVKVSEMPVSMSPERADQFLLVFSSHFDNDKDRWKAYCEKIANIKFLTGEAKSGFKVTFDWAIKPKNIIKILEGVIYDRPESENAQEFIEDAVSIEEYAADLKEQRSGSYPSSWIDTQLDILSQVGVKTYQSWFAELKPGVVEDSTAILYAPTQFVRDKLHTEFYEILRTTYLTDHPDAIEISLKVSPKEFVDESLRDFTHEKPDSVTKSAQPSSSYHTPESEEMGVSHG